MIPYISDETAHFLRYVQEMRSIFAEFISIIHSANLVDYNTNRKF